MSRLHTNTEVGRVSQGSQITTIQQADTRTDIPIVMGDDMYTGTEEQQCFVLVDERTVGVMPGDPTTMQRLLTTQDSTTTTITLGSDGSKGMEMVQVEGKDAVEMMHVPAGRTVLHMDDGKTLELVQMDGGKTLEVMNIDASNHPDVLQVEGSSNIELISEGDMEKGPMASSCSSSMMLSKRKSKYLLPGPEEMSVKQVITSQGRDNTTEINLRSITTVTPSIVLSTGKRVLTSQNFTHIASQSTFSARKKSHVIGAAGLQTLTHHVKSNIIFSDTTKQVLSSADSGMNDAIIISWPTLEAELENTVATQTDPCDSYGPSMNLFFCTFYPDGSVQAQCDMPAQCHKGVSTESRGGCGGQGQKWGSGSQSGERDPLAVKMEGEDQRYSRSGRILKGKGPLFKFSSSDLEDDRDGNTDYEFQDEGQEAVTTPDHQSLVFRKKRGRKKKRRLPSPDNFEEELQLSNGDKDEMDGPESEVAIKSEPMDAEDEELAMEILRIKGYGLRTKRRLKKLSDMHYMQEKAVKKRMDRSQEFSCQMCERIFPTFSRLQRHAKEEHDSTEFSFPCDVCSVVFTRPHNLERHKDTKHGNGERRFVCEHCGRRFGRQDVLSVHISMVHLKGTIQGKKGPSILGSITFHCTSCDKFFSKEQRLKEHRQGDLTCADCNLSFECKTSLRIHQYKHHPTACSECGKVCDNKQQMYFHRLSHTPKFVCNYCNKGFLWKSQYTVHIATHTGEKPVLCDICGKSFAHKLAVSKHKWQEHNENNKKFKCEQCGKSFVYRGKLQSHMRSHTGEKPFTCHLCPSTFSQRCNLTAHIKSVHGVYIHSIKSDGTTHMELVKYKRAKKPSPQLAETTSQTAIVNTVMAPPVHSPPPDQTPVATIQEQVQMSESSFETEAAVYQIVMYPQ